MAADPERISLAVPLLLQAPPGEVVEVLADIRGLVGDNDALQAAILPVLERYNTEQFVTTRIPGAEHSVIVSNAGQIPGTQRYTDPRAAKSFAFDHLRGVASDPQALPVDEAIEKFRSALDTAMLSYVSDHYSEGVSTVYTTTTAPIESPNSRPADQAATDAAQSPSVPVGVAGTGADAADAEVDDSIKEARQPDSDVGEDVRDDPVDAAESADAVETDDAVEDKNAPKADPRFVIHIVGNRFNLNNYWSGRWRSSYTIELASPESLNASIEVQVHYFENGNVQLSSSRPTSLALTPSPSQGSSHPTPESLAADPIAFGRAVQHTIAKHEAEYQEALDEAYSNLSERAFKALRRQLPVTRQKIDWDKAMHFKLGAELGKS